MLPEAQRPAPSRGTSCGYRGASGGAAAPLPGALDLCPWRLREDHPPVAGAIIAPTADAAVTLDETDHRLIALLRHNARMPMATLAAKLSVSRGTIHNRLRKLEDAGVITGYTVQLRPDARPDEIRAWMGIQVEGNQTRLVIASLLGEPGVAELHDTNGRWDLLAELRAGSMSELSQVLERIRLLKGIRGTETSIQLATYR